MKKTIKYQIKDLLTKNSQKSGCSVNITRVHDENHVGLPSDSKSSNSIELSINEELVDLNWIKRKLVSKGVLDQVKSKLKGSGRRCYITKKDYLSISINVVTLAEQKAFSELIEAVDIHQILLEKKRFQLLGFLEKAIEEKTMLGETYKLGDLLQQVKRPPALTNPKGNIGVSCAFKGVFHKPYSSSASNIEVCTNDLIMSRGLAWDGAVGIISLEFNQYQASRYFRAFELNDRLILPEFIMVLFKYTRLKEEVRNISYGSTNRNKIFDLSLFYEIVIRLPEIAIQRDLLNLENQIVNQYKAIISVNESLKSFLLKGINSF